METRTNTTILPDTLTYLPRFAAFLLNEHLDEYIQHQSDAAIELDLPIFKYFINLPEEERMAISRQTSSELLTALAQNQAREFIEQSMEQWLKNRLPVVDRDAIVAEDITLINHIRKRAMVAFIPAFTTDAQEILALVSEIDLFLMENITVATNQYMNLFRMRLEENTHFSEKVAETIPGAVYVFDYKSHENIYSNKKLAAIIGYEPSELNALGDAAVETLVHPDDRPALKQHLNAMKNGGAETRLIKYRIRHKDGQYRWLANYESVFKTTADGKIWQTIGITLDIDNEQRAVAELEQREKLLVEAQNIAQLGNYYWDFGGRNSYGSAKTYEILDVSPAQDTFFDQLYTEDKQKVTDAVAEAKRTGHFNCEYRIRTNKGLRYIWARGAVDFKNGEPHGMHGTVMDVTEHHQLVQKLAEADMRHRQAEALAHIGTYEWNIASDEIHWSDEMYSIYGLNKSTSLRYSIILEHVVPEDKAMLDGRIQDSIRTGKSYDFYYRIKAPGGVKILHTRGNVYPNEEGSLVRIVGTDQDVTEKQQLIRRLQQSESIYKQVEEIADMGNWSYDLESKRTAWTDQLYRIYGLEPQSEEITTERFLSFVHPDDRDVVSAGIKRLGVDEKQDYTFRIVAGDGTEKWLRSIAQLVRNETGKPTLLIGTEQNVTEKQRLIRKLEESQRLYKQAQELSKLGNFSWTLASDEVFWSDEVYKIYDKPSGCPVRFSDAFEPIIDEHKPQVQKAIEETIETRKGRSVAYAIRKPNRELRYVNLHTDVLLEEDGAVLAVIGTAQDVTEKEELINRLRESEQLFKQAQSLAHLGNWTFDLRTQEVTWSDELFAIYEREPGKPISGDEWLRYVDSNEREKVIQDFHTSLAEGTGLETVHTINLPDGRQKVLHRRGELVRDSAGNPVKLVGTTQDITEQYRTQAELRESQTFIKKITDATPSIIASYNVNTGRYTYVSEGLEKLLGYKTEEVMEKGVAFFAAIIHPEDVAGITEKNLKALEEANATGGKKDIVAEFTYRMRHRDGDYRWFHTYGTVFDYTAEGKVDHVLNITLDVTEQKEAVETIREQEYFIQQVADASPTILYLLDVPTQSVAYINREAFFVLGYLPEEIIEEGAGVTAMLYHPDDLELLPARTQSAKNFQQVDSMIQYECRMKHKDGGYRWMLVREIVFKADEHGAVTQIIGAALDITRRKEMERTILQNAHQLEQSNASLEEFAYVASHDLKEPLRKISTFGDRLVASHADRLSDDGKIYLNKIVDASQRMQNMISDLLSISMISGNRQFERVSLQKTMEETLQTLEYKIEQQKAVIRYDALPEANVVPSQFRQLFQNLVANSLKFVRDGVQPVITVTSSEPTEEEQQRFKLTKPSGYLKLVFSDNGIGFEKEYAQKIFAIFQRLHGRSEYEGSGIGLAICKKIAEHHGGVIFAAGQPDVGATFTLIIPA